MPKGLRRYFGGGDCHFITCSCYRRQPLLGTRQRRDLFLQILEQVRRRYQAAKSRSTRVSNSARPGAPNVEKLPTELRLIVRRPGPPACQQNQN